MKRFKLIFFMSLILILILGTTSQAVVSEEYMNYIWTNLENNSDFNNSGSYNTNFKSYLQQLTSEQKNSVKTKINQYLNANNLNYEDVNLNTFLSYDAEVTFNIYFVFSNNTAPNNNDLGYLEIKNDQYNTTRLYVKDNDGIIKYLKVKVAFYNNFLHFTVSDFKELSSGGLSVKLGKTAYSENTDIFYSSNISCYKLTQTAYIGYPISSTTETTRFLRNYIAYISTDEGAYIPNEPDNPDEPSGDIGTGGTTGTITNPSGDTTGKVDLSGIEQGIGAVKDAVNNVTNTIKDAFTFNSGDANEVMEDFKNTDLGLSQDLYDLNDQFFELFETEQIDDFKISWNSVNYQDVQLIPSGDVNFSALCRENEQIGKVKEYISLFAIVGASLTLLKVIWNMISGMLGLNETLTETDFGDAKMYTYEDNSYDVDTRAYLDSKRYNRRR